MMNVVHVIFCVGVLVALLLLLPDLAKYFSTSFHGHTSNYRNFYVSEPLQGGSSAGVDWKARLGGARSTRAGGRGISEVMDAHLLCADCDEHDDYCANINSWNQKFLSHSCLHIHSLLVKFILIWAANHCMRCGPGVVWFCWM
jgi:hypothetical protein